mgnify:CR=1 FL=1
MSHTIKRFAENTPMWVYEENFRLLVRLLPELGEGECFRIFSAEGRTDVEIRVIERCKYTVTLEITKYFGSGGKLLPDLSMKARVYYDARVVEVMSYQECHRIPSRYEVSDAIRFHLDEKFQSNELLHDLLCYCFGRDYDVVAEAGCASV